MTRPDGTYGTSGSPTQAWWPAAPQQAPNPGTQPLHQGYQQPYPSYPPQQAYPGAWHRSSSPFPPAPIAPAPPRTPGKPSVGKLVALAVAGFVLVALLGGAVLLATGKVATPLGDAPAAPAVTIALPPTIDGHPQIDNEYSRQLVDAARQQLAPVSANPVVGMYGDPGQPPAFVVIAGPTTVADPDMVLTGMAAGFQQSMGSGELTFVDQPAGPLGGTMRCAEHAPMTTCMWTVEGAFGMNMVFQQDLTQAAATTLRVRDAIETHAG